MKKSNASPGPIKSARFSEETRATGGETTAGAKAESKPKPQEAKASSREAMPSTPKAPKAPKTPKPKKGKASPAPKGEKPPKAPGSAALPDPTPIPSATGEAATADVDAAMEAAHEAAPGLDRAGAELKAEAESSPTAESKHKRPIAEPNSPDRAELHPLEPTKLKTDRGTADLRAKIMMRGF